MAGSVVVTCPECEKKFKPKTDVQGKRIKCPFCQEPFVVPEAEADEVPEPEEKAAPAPAPPPARSDLDADPDPYGVKTVELVPRCPNCTEEMESEHAVICLACGYNTLTRQWGKTEKIVGLTFGRHFLYLLPALGAAAFTFFSIIGLILYSTVISPLLDPLKWWGMFDLEALKFWITTVFLGWMWGAGVFCYKKFIEKPKPDEVALD
ncbi:MAG: hypothetical protein HYX68_21390 [Planctomycetes bacterium]|nr:hypothetical protein [Planctomycetota bacterium]